MRLINTTTFELKQFAEAEIPPYAILSHTWGEEEVLFHEMGEQEISNKQGFKKIEGFCAEAKRHGFEYGWVDTCCIDKSSSSELSEAINSMFYWYKEAKVCYTYLADVLKPSSTKDKDWKDSFAGSRWFTRGWTLQELIAPSKLEFYSKSWERIGDKVELIKHLAKITGVSKKILSGGDLDDASVAEKMSWASKRVTTRPEDIAYCLLGLFGVHMTLLYGERERAFIRLQRQIVEEIHDPTIFVWEMDKSERDRDLSRANGLFADSPANFINSSKIVGADEFYGVYSMHNIGLQIRMPLARDTHTPDEYIAVLNCRMEGADNGNRIAIKLQVGERRHVVKKNWLTRRLGTRILSRKVDEGERRVFVRNGSIHPFVIGAKEVKNAVFETVYIITSVWDTSVLD